MVSVLAVLLIEDMLKFYPSWFVFFVMLIVGVGLVARSENWFMIWVGFELLLLGFLPMFTVGSLVIEGIVKYFLVQAMGSRLFLASFIVVGFDGLLFFVSMLVKLGLFPFYHWVPIVMTSMHWMGCLLLSTLQKLGPLLILFLQRRELKYLLLLSGGIRVFVSGLLGYNQVYIRRLMGYSSIAHTGWMVVGLVFDLYIFLFYFFLYFYLLSILFFLFDRFNILMVVRGWKRLRVNSSISLLMFVLSGVPPFSFFFMKAGLVYYLSSFIFVASFFILGAILSVYYYLNFIIPSLSSFWREG